MCVTCKCGPDSRWIKLMLLPSHSRIRPHSLSHPARQRKLNLNNNIKHNQRHLARSSNSSSKHLLDAHPTRICRHKIICSKALPSKICRPKLICNRGHPSKTCRLKIVCSKVLPSKACRPKTVCSQGHSDSQVSHSPITFFRIFLAVDANPDHKIREARVGKGVTHRA